MAFVYNNYAKRCANLLDYVFSSVIKNQHENQKKFDMQTGQTALLLYAAANIYFIAGTYKLIPIVSQNLSKV